MTLRHIASGCCPQGPVLPSVRPLPPQLRVQPPTYADNVALPAFARFRSNLLPAHCCGRTPGHQHENCVPSCFFNSSRVHSLFDNNTGSCFSSFGSTCRKKGKGSSHSIAERRVPELIPLPAGDVSHKPGDKKGKVFPYSLPSVGPGADPGVQAVSPQVT